LLYRVHSIDPLSVSPFTLVVSRRDQRTRYCKLTGNFPGTSAVAAQHGIASSCLRKPIHSTPIYGATRSMNDNADRPCFYCERAPAIAGYGLCTRCASIPARRRIYRFGRGQTPEWEAHLLYLTERAKQRLPLFTEGYVSPPRPQRGRRKPCDEPVPRVFRLTLPGKEDEE
jgi:hypothetical protein